MCGFFSQVGTKPGRLERTAVHEKCGKGSPENKMSNLLEKQPVDKYLSKVNNMDTRATFMDDVIASLLLTLNRYLSIGPRSKYVTICSVSSIQVDTLRSLKGYFKNGCVDTILIDFISCQQIMLSILN